jgi:hypothetical protein
LANGTWARHRSNSIWLVVAKCCKYVPYCSIHTCDDDPDWDIVIFGIAWSHDPAMVGGRWIAIEDRHIAQVICVGIFLTLGLTFAAKWW